MNLPYDTELETLIIGDALLRNSIPIEARAIPATDFYFVKNQRIWATMLACTEEGVPIDIFDLKARIDSPDVTVSSLSQFSLGLPVTTNVTALEVNRLRDLATLRRMMTVFSELGSKAESKTPILDIVDEAQMFLDTVTNQQDSRTGTSQTIIEVMEYEVFPRLDKFVSGELVKIPFGFEQLDLSTNGGASLGELVVYGALPKSGKSSMMLQIARHIASLNLPTLVVSLEMLNYENGFRFLAQSSKYSVNVFRPDMRDFVAQGLKEHAKTHYEMPLFFDQKARSMKEVAKEVRRLKEQFGLKAAVIDYPQLMKGERRNIGRTERIEEVFYDMKELAMKEEIVVHAPAQFNREGIKSDTPTLAHFDGSSAIEKTANLGIFWQLDKEYSPDVDGRKGRLWIEMGRSVANDSFDGLVFHGKEAKFTLR